MKGYLLYILIFTVLSFVEGDRECGLENVYCQQSNIYYRTVDGSCNNLEHPNWGTRFSVYDRLVPARYGKWDSFALSRRGRPLPNARSISLEIFTEDTYPHSEYTLNAIQYGQIVAHDISDSYLTRGAEACCDLFLKELHPPPDDCASIKIPHDDPTNSFVNATCMSVLRTLTNRQQGCSLYLPQTTQISNVTAFLDLSVIYGSTEEVLYSVRAYKGGFVLVDLKDNNEWLPNCIIDRQLFCPAIPDTERCYYTGDHRVNQNPQLTILHIIWAREHNRVARELSKLNPHWNDEQLFQVARTITIAEHQHITYYELLPYYCGKQNLKDLGILFDTDGFINDYDERVRPHAFNEFSQAAYRHFHSMIPGTLSLVDSTGCPYRSVILRDTVARPHFLEKGDNFDSLIRGMATQPCLSSDAQCDPEITNFFGEIFLKTGFDIRAVDIQRSRDHGLGSYNDMREFCQLGRVEYFHQLYNVMDQESVIKLASLYEHPDDIDLVVGGTLEKAAPGTIIGPTFLCIMYQQFYRTRISDRFFFENGYNGFTVEQLREIRKSSISKLLCDNGNHITYMQKKGFLQVSESNPQVPCQMIPGPDLTLWKEPYYSYYHSK